MNQTQYQPFDPAGNKYGELRPRRVVSVVVAPREIDLAISAARRQVLQELKVRLQAEEWLNQAGALQIIDEMLSGGSDARD